MCFLHVRLGWVKWFPLKIESWKCFIIHFFKIEFFSSRCDRLGLYCIVPPLQFLYFSPSLINKYLKFFEDRLKKWHLPKLHDLDIYFLKYLYLFMSQLNILHLLVELEPWSLSLKQWDDRRKCQFSTLKCSAARTQLCYHVGIFLSLNFQFCWLQIRISRDYLFDHSTNIAPLLRGANKNGKKRHKCIHVLFILVIFPIIVINIRECI